jgi:hypothetical protein
MPPHSVQLTPKKERVVQLVAEGKNELGDRSSDRYDGARNQELSSSDLRRDGDGQQGRAGPVVLGAFQPRL